MRVGRRDLPREPRRVVARRVGPPRRDPLFKISDRLHSHAVTCPWHQALGYMYFTNKRSHFGALYDHNVVTCGYMPDKPELTLPRVSLRLEQRWRYFQSFGEAVISAKILARPKTLVDRPGIVGIKPMCHHGHKIGRS